MINLQVILLTLLTLNFNIIVSHGVCNTSILSEESEEESYSYKNVSTKSCNCDKQKEFCIRKCCKIGYYMIRNYCKKYLNLNNTFEIPIHKTSTHLKNLKLENHLAGVMRCKFYKVEYNVTNEDTFFMQENGEIYLTKSKIYLTNENYCIDDYEKRVLAAFVCFGNKYNLPNGINITGMIISMPFLLMTFLVYAFLPERNLHMKALMTFVMNLLLAYIMLVSIQLWTGQMGNVSCYLMGYLCLFFFTTSFFWMNVICIDIWLGFSGMRGYGGNKKTAEKKRFLLYSGYAFGSPLLLVLIVVLINEFVNESNPIHPSMGIGQCFLKNGLPYLIYFYGPMGLLITINVILFALTALKIIKVKKETSMLKKTDSKKHTYEKDKQKFNLYLKLLLAMGINWSMELISWFFNYYSSVPPYFWYLTDLCNACYGVIIFFIFVFKKSIWNMLRRRYYSFIGRPHYAHSTTNNTRTTSTGYSQTEVTNLQEMGSRKDNRESVQLTSSA